MKKVIRFCAISLAILGIILITAPESKAQCTVTSTNGWTATFNIIPTTVIPEFTNCPWYYHYEIRYTMSVTFSGAYTNRSISCNVYFNCTGGTGNQPYNSGGTYTSNSTVTLTTNNNARQYSAVSMNNYGTNPNCNQVSLAAVNCKTVRIDYWGSGMSSGTIICNVPVPLPITLLSFSAERKSKSVQLNWSTATEINNSFFTIERSANGKEFEEIGKMPGAGNSNTIKNYDFNDKKLKYGISYYRIKQTDFDGQFSYSPIVAVRYFENDHKLIILPNPLINNGIAKLNSSQSGICNFMIINQLGAILMSRKIELSEGEQVIDFDASSLSPGIYSIITSDQTDTIRKSEFVKH